MDVIKIYPTSRYYCICPICGDDDFYADDQDICEELLIDHMKEKHKEINVDELEFDDSDICYNC